MTDKELKLIKRIEADIKELAKISNTEKYLSASLVNGNFLVSSEYKDGYMPISYFKEANNE